jgi:hypothetical protein
MSGIKISRNAFGSLMFKAVGHIGKDTLQKKNIDCLNDKDAKKVRGRAHVAFSSLKCLR